MKKIISLLVLLSLCFLLINPVEAASVEKIKQYIKSLNTKMKIAKNKRQSARIKKLKQMIIDAEDQLFNKENAKQEDRINKEDKEDSVKQMKTELAAIRKETGLIKSELDAKISSLKEIARDRAASVHGRAYIYYEKDTIGKSGIPNRFEIGRVYLDYKNKFDQNSSVRVTSDVSRTQDKLDLYLKYAYFEFNNIDSPSLGLKTVRIGQSPTHWIGMIEKQWRFRYVAKTLTDQYGYFDSADLGVSVLGTIDLSRLNIPFNVDYHTILMNGQGYQAAEINSGKDIGLTLKAEPLYFGKADKVITAAGVLAEDVDLSSLDLTDSDKKLSALISYQFSNPEKGIVFVEYANQLQSEDGGISIGGNYQFIKETNIFARLDNFRKSGDDYIQRILGVEYKWNKNIRAAFDFKQEIKNKATSSKILALHSQVSW